MNLDTPSANPFDPALPPHHVRLPAHDPPPRLSQRFMERGVPPDAGGRRRAPSASRTFRRTSRVRRRPGGRLRRPGGHPRNPTPGGTPRRRGTPTRSRKPTRGDPEDAPATTGGTSADTGRTPHGDPDGERPRKPGGHPQRPGGHPRRPEERAYEGVRRANAVRGSSSTWAKASSAAPTKVASSPRAEVRSRSRSLDATSVVVLIWLLIWAAAPR